MPKPAKHALRSASLNSTAEGASGTYEVSSVRKALDILACFSLEKPVWALSTLARHLELPKSTVHNLLRTLQIYDFVRQDPEARNYRLGPRALEMGLVFARSTEMLAAVRPLLRRLAEDGAAVLLYSTDYAELIGCCDRVAVFFDGRIVRWLAGDELTERALVASALNLTTTEAAAA